MTGVPPQRCWHVCWWPHSFAICSDAATVVELWHAAWVVGHVSSSCTSWGVCMANQPCCSSPCGGGDVGQGTVAFRRLFGFTEVVGASPLELLPAQCALRLGFFPTAAMTFALPLVLIALAVTISLVALIVRHMKSRSFVSKLDNLHPDLQSQMRRFRAERSHSRGGDSPVRSVMTREAVADELPLVAKIRDYIGSRRYLSSVMFILFLSYNLIGSSVMRVIQCHPTAIGGKYYLSADFSIVRASKRGSVHWYVPGY